MILPISGLLLTCYGHSQVIGREFPPEAAQAAGFALMHAAWSISDVPKGENLIPLALVGKDGKQELLRFESKTSTREAVTKGLEHLKKEEKTLDYWALVYDSYEHKEKLKTDALVVQVWSAHSTHTLYILQKYEPFARHGKFKILGTKEIVLDGKSLSGKDAQPILNDIELGLKSHPKFELWKTWQS